MAEDHPFNRQYVAVTAVNAVAFFGDVLQAAVGVVQPVVQFKVASLLQGGLNVFPDVVGVGRVDQFAEGFMALVRSC